MYFYHEDLFVSLQTGQTLSLHLGLHCLPKYLLASIQNERVNIFHNTRVYIPSNSLGGGPAFNDFGVFMKSGNIVRKPRISTNFWQLSVPSIPVMAWFNTLMAQFLDNFFSLQERIRILY